MAKQDPSTGLSANSLGLVESIIMGVAGTAPAFSIAATTSLLFIAVGFQSIASLLYCGLIMFGVSLAFMHLNRTYPNAGASFIWVGDIFHPILGFFAGWSLLVAAAVFMVSGTIPAAVATLALFNPDYMNNPIVVALIAAIWLILINLVVVKGIKLSSYFQMFLTILEVGFLIMIIAGAIWTFYSTPKHPFSLDQLSLFHFSLESFTSGALIALFFFWGWDVTVNLSEETKDSTENPGKGATGAMLIVLLLFISFMISAQFALTEKEIDEANTNLIMAVSEKIFPSPFSYIAIIAVILSTIGTLETTILQFTRTLYAKGRAGLLNPKYAKLHQTWKTPYYASFVIGGIGLVLIGCFAFLPSVNQMIAISVKAIGFQVACYYGLACFACAWKFRNCVYFKDYILLFFWPLLSGIFMAFIFVYCALTFDWVTSLLGIGGILIGAIPLYWNASKNFPQGEGKL
jgi:amino acid transporter